MVEFLVKLFGLLFACSKMRGIPRAVEKQCINKQLLGCSDKTQRMAPTPSSQVTQIGITWDVPRTRCQGFPRMKRGTVYDQSKM